MNGDEQPKMSREVAVLWTLAAVALVLFFSALVSKREQDLNGSYIVPARTTTNTCVARCVP